jgi:hypothetical protein
MMDYLIFTAGYDDYLRVMPKLRNPENRVDLINLRLG